MVPVPPLCSSSFKQILAPPLFVPTNSLVSRELNFLFFFQRIRLYQVEEGSDVESF